METAATPLVMRMAQPRLSSLARSWDERQDLLARAREGETISATGDPCSLSHDPLGNVPGPRVSELGNGAETPPVAGRADAGVL